MNTMNINKLCKNNIFIYIAIIILVYNFVVNSDMSPFTIGLISFFASLCFVYDLIKFLIQHYVYKVNFSKKYTRKVIILGLVGMFGVVVGISLLVMNYQ